MNKIKKITIKTLKILGISILILGVIIGVITYNSINYNTYSLKIDKSKFPNVKTEKDIEQLAEKLVKEMSFEEKVDQMYGEKKSKSPKLIFNFMIKNRFPHVYSGRNDRLNIPPWVLSDGPRGARVMEKKIDAVTTFPVAMSRGASWDPALEYRVNEVISKEMIANQANYAATPCINLLRHPGWGRAQETYGEDPWLLGEFGIAAVKAIEKHNVMACPKHFALNSIENSRWVVDVQLDERTLREVYLPHFKRTIQEGKPASIMSAYNQVRGEYCGSNKELLTDILRNEWGFEGFVTTDWMYGTYDAVKSVKAGLNVEMPWQDEYSYEVLQKGIDEGKIIEADIDKLVYQSLKTRLKYAFSADVMDYDTSIILQKSHIELAREAAEAGMVLLKNGNVLPFKKGNGKKIAVIGRLANEKNTGDKGSSDSTPPYVVTPFEGIKNYHEKLGNEVILNDGVDLASAKKMANQADEVILVVGYTAVDEGEYIILSKEDMEISAKAHHLVGDKGMGGGDRESLKLLSSDEELIKSLASTNKNLVVVYIGGSAIDMSNWENKVPAILFAWYAGMEGGNALANILYGDVNPSGKLPFSIAKNEKDYPYFNPYIDKITYGYYHGYTLFDKKNIDVAYPFGYGKSYTNFEFANLQVKDSILNENDILDVKIDVTNTGKISGKEVVQLYIGFKNSVVDRPVKLLRDFEKILLNSGETKTVKLQVAVKDIAWYNPDKKEWIIDFMEYELYVGNSSDEKDLMKGNFIVE